MSPCAGKRTGEANRRTTPLFLRWTLSRGSCPWTGRASFEPGRPHLGHRWRGIQGAGNPVNRCAGRCTGYGCACGPSPVARTPPGFPRLRLGRRGCAPQAPPAAWGLPACGAGLRLSPWTVGTLAGCVTQTGAWLPPPQGGPAGAGRTLQGCGLTPWPHGAAVAPLHTRLCPVLRAMLAEATGTVCKQTVPNRMVAKACRVRPPLSHATRSEPPRSVLGLDRAMEKHVVTPSPGAQSCRPASRLVPASLLCASSSVRRLRRADTV